MYKFLLHSTAKFAGENSNKSATCKYVKLHVWIWENLFKKWVSDIRDEQIRARTNRTFHRKSLDTFWAVAEEDCCKQSVPDYQRIKENTHKFSETIPAYQFPNFQDLLLRLLLVFSADKRQQDSGKADS